MQPDLFVHGLILSFFLCHIHALLEDFAFPFVRESCEMK